jgi:universal stress protein E
MQHVFHNILVGVPPFQGRHSLSAQQAVHSALWLAGQTSTPVTFFSVLPSADAATASATSKVLSALVKQAEERGIQQARSGTAEGGPAGEIIRQVHRGGHDLVMLGAPGTTGLAYALFSSTATRLLNTCPCPVWLAVPAANPRLGNVLVASDLTAGSENALRVGVGLAQAVHASAHVLHVVDYPLDHHWSTGEADALTKEYHHQIRAAAEAALAEQLHRIGSPSGAKDVHIHIVGRTGIADLEILHFIRAHQIDLLVTGITLGGSLDVSLLGHTAERLLPEIPCAVLVVKPEQ